MSDTAKKKKVVFCTPSLAGPTAPYIKALEDSIPLIVGAGWDEAYVQELGNPYISVARATMTRKALDANADVLIYLDYDLSWDPGDLLKLLEAEGDVVCGTYRFKKDEEEYMGALLPIPGIGGPIVRADGALEMGQAPAGFLKVTKRAIQAFMRGFPELLYGEPDHFSIDLFNHGAHKGVWYGEDYAFCRNWREIGGKVWCVPDLNLHHHSGDKIFPGNFHRYLEREPDGYRKAA